MVTNLRVILGRKGNEEKTESTSSEILSLV